MGPGSLDLEGISVLPQEPQASPEGGRVLQLVRDSSHGQQVALTPPYMALECLSHCSKPPIPTPSFFFNLSLICSAGPGPLLPLLQRSLPVGEAVVPPPQCPSDSAP